ncbi:HAD-IIB family hydrolase [Sulfitobacter sp. S190]|uniref:HAD-IIB family hydrolase n=1 Tax=Sulfitobacter sp. S190 TaxID=2867022 RepID=UPI0021A8D1AB|nr:HAD-IIB family hydrolase [Sulfitobacter sp. S190]UWR21196.1 HAD-IIB family hydrolase [Sulfitobacter sp. S190]
MYIMHIALGGCFTMPEIDYGITEDTGGHIGYIAGAATAQAKRTDVHRVDIITRLFRDPALGSDYAKPLQTVAPKLNIRRIETRLSDYLSKEALADHIPEITQSFLRLLASQPRKPDIIHAHFADAAVLATAAKERFGIPFIYTPHSFGIDKASCTRTPPCASLTRRISQEKEALRNAEAIVVSSRDEAERQVVAYDADVCGHVHRVAPGVTIAPPRDMALTKASSLLARHLADPVKPFVLAVARPVHRKNLAILLKAFRSRAELRERANLVIVSGQHETAKAPRSETARVIAELRMLAQAPELAGRIALPARHDHQLIAELYALAARQNGLFANPALHEPFGLTLLEAALFQLPVVATKHGGPADIMRQMAHGILVEPTDQTAIGDALCTLLTDKAAYRDAQLVARTQFHRFSWTAWAAQVQMIYRSAVAPAREQLPAPAKLLACDIDNTLTGSKAAASAFGAWAQNRGIAFCVNTGRCITEARSVLAKWHLPEPDFFITAVGTEIHARDRFGKLRLDRGYADLLSADWDRAEVFAQLRDMEATLQPDIEQRAWKISCFGSAFEADLIRYKMAQAGLRVRVIASHGRMIDVVPMAAGKANALAYAARTIGLSLADCIAAGDSGNDMDMLAASGTSILVSNALAEATKNGAPPQLYRARAAYADGVLEGLARYGHARKPALPSATVPLSSGVLQ